MDRKSYAVLTVTEAVNEKERDPVNSVYNTDTRYVEISDQLDDAQRDTLLAVYQSSWAIQYFTSQPASKLD